MYCHSGLEQEERWGCGNRFSCRETKVLSLEVLELRWNMLRLRGKLREGIDFFWEVWVSGTPFYLFTVLSMLKMASAMLQVLLTYVRNTRQKYL